MEHNNLVEKAILISFNGSSGCQVSDSNQDWAKRPGGSFLHLLDKSKKAKFTVSSLEVPKDIANFLAIRGSKGLIANLNAVLCDRFEDAGEKAPDISVFRSSENDSFDSGKPPDEQLSISYSIDSVNVALGARLTDTPEQRLFEKGSANISGYFGPRSPTFRWWMANGAKTLSPASP